MRTAWMLLALGCNHAMGEPCRSSNACVEPGLCLSGVCSGYDCASDADCDNGLVCGTVDDVAACLLECDADGDCAGQQRCHEVETSVEAQSAVARYCL